MEILDDIEENVQKNPIYQKLSTASQKLNEFLTKEISNFPKIFNPNYQSLQEVESHLKKISLPNKYVCAKYINILPGWTCKECARYTDSIFCHECYKKSKHLHKGHHLYFLPNSGGMCGCGEPEALSTFCPEHSGPHMTQRYIDEYIAKVFDEELLEKLKKFFDKIFEEIYYYLLLGEKCELFCPELLDIYLDNMLGEEHYIISEEKIYINSSKNDFKKVFEYFLDFLNSITKDNLGMLYLISNYFMKSNFNKNLVNDDYKTNHRCVKFDINNIEIIKTGDEPHICQCPFFTLLVLNWRDNIEVNQNLLLSFTRNFPLKHAFGIIYFCFFEKILQNKNTNFIDNRIQFILDYSTKLLVEKTNIIEETYDIFYKYCCEKMKGNEIKNYLINDIYLYARIIDYDSTLFSMPITKNSMKNSKYLIKRIIDCMCLIHNKNEFRTINPHPIFQNKGCSGKLIDLEIKLLNIIQSIDMFTNWSDIKNIKEIFNYLINKITNQKSEGIKQLKHDEFSFHLGLYRCFGLLINYFCFYYALSNNCTLLNSIEYFKTNFFESKNQLENFISIILNDYFKLFAFVSGIKNGFFNYYESMYIYSRVYFIDQQFIKLDITLLKYLLSISENDLKFYDLLKKTNIEQTFSFFQNIFSITKENKIMIKKNLSSDELLDLLNSTKDIFPNVINYGDNLQIIQSLYQQCNTQIDSNIIQHYINGTLDELTNSKMLNINIDEFHSIMHIKLILDFLVIVIKDDSSLYYNLMKLYKTTSSALTKKELFENIKKNKHCMKDLNNIIKEKIVCEFTSNGNLNNIDTILKKIDDYLLIIFEENEINDILEELTSNKKIGNKQLYYLKDSSFKYFDTSFYYSSKDCSNAQKYIYDFKKNLVKAYNTYFFQNSELTFDLYECVYEKIFLNENNLQFLYRVIKKIFWNEKNNNKDVTTLKYIILPVILKYLSIFGCINTKSFIEYKIKNEETINEIILILSNSVEDKNNQILFNEENIIEVINQLNSYKIINTNIKNDLTKLNKYELNFDKINQIKDMKNVIIKNDSNDNNNCKNKKIKEKLRNKMKYNNIKFFDNAKNDKEIFNEINIQNEIEEQNIDDENETMCFFCRKKIKLNSFDEPYGQGGYAFSDYFFSNSLNSSINEELKIINKENNTNHNISKKNKSIKFTSCGHYFHFSCYNLENNDAISCPLCLKNINILIPPLNNFYSKYEFLKPYTIKSLYEKNEINLEVNLFVDMINDFLSNILNYSEDDDIMEKFIVIFKYSFNYIENLFYYKASNFHKLQQIKMHQNFILIIRLLLKIDIIDSQKVINDVIDNLSHLIKGPTQEENILNNYENMYYIEIFEKILLYLSVIFDYYVMKETALYIIYIFLPYICFGLYLKDSIAKSDYFPYFDEKISENLNLDNVLEYIELNNEKIMNVLKLFLQKFALMKLITNYNQKEEDIITNKLYDLNITEYFSFLGINNSNIESSINNDNNKDSLKFKTILEIFNKSLNTPNIFEDKIENKFDFNEMINSLIKNIKKEKNSKDKHLIKKELLVHFSLIKFKFIELEENYFDLIEKYLEKECIICNNVSRYYYICLICGNKICHTTLCDRFFVHKKNCGGKNCIFLNMDDGEIMIADNTKKYYTGLYLNKQGVGPNSKRVNNGYKLDKEKQAQYFRNYISYDFHFN